MFRFKYFYNLLKLSMTILVYIPYSLLRILKKYLFQGKMPEYLFLFSKKFWIFFFLVIPSIKQAREYIVPIPSFFQQPNML